jgi:serpin B
MKKLFPFILCAISILNGYSQNNLVIANNNFAFKLYKATKPDTSNFFISPFSLNIALSIANEGAKSTTRNEIDNLLCINNVNQRDILYNSLIKKTINLKDSTYYNCIKWSNGDTEGNVLYLANSLWINNNFQIDQAFRKTIEDKCSSQVFAFEKNDIPPANQRLNKWISEKTLNKINQITGLHSDIKMSIINAIYFLGEWNNPFEKKKTKKKNFHAITKDKIKIDFMNDQSNYEYFEDDEIQSLFIHYKCDQLSMVIILPQKRYGINTIESKLSYDYFSNIEKLSRYQEVILSLPKFKIETELLPKKEIIKMGYNEMFSDKANFTNISKIDSLKIDQIIHKTFINVDEKKTEAAAVSKADMVVIGYGVGGDHAPPPPPKIFNADHSFTFLIVDNRTKAILFNGRFVR